jgi:hypothetical protein
MNKLFRTIFIIYKYMLCKQVTISIPETEEIPEILSSLNSKFYYDKNWL